MLATNAAHPERIPPAAALNLVRAYATAPGFQAANDAMRASRFTALGDIDVPVTLAWPEHDRLVRRPRSLPAGVRSVVLPAAATCRPGTTRSRWLACCWRAAPANVNPGIEGAGSRLDCHLCRSQVDKGDNRPTLAASSLSS